MMNRILIKDVQGNLFRIYSFGFGLDYKKEEYIKFSFPDLIGTPIIFNDTESYDPEEKLINEFSIHINGGVSHFKSLNQKRFYRKENELDENIKEAKMIHLFDYNLYDLGHFKVFNKRTKECDYILNNVFDIKKGKVLQFYLVLIEENILLPNIRYNHIEWKGYHSLIIDKKYRLLVVEYDFINLDKSETGIAFFRRNNIKQEYIETNINEKDL